MKTTYLTIFAALLTLSLSAQETKTYKGPYATGVAEYTYTENDKLQRLINGRFTYNDTIEVEGRGECALQMTGGFRDDKKVGPWVASVKALDNSSNETVTGPYLNGQKSGLWTHRVTIEETDIKISTATFNRNKFKGKLSYKYEPLEPVAEYKKMEVNGGFDDNGYFDGEWKLTYTNMNDQDFEDVLRYQHGVIAFRVKREILSGKELERYDNEAFVTAFFKGMDKLDSSSVVEDQKYGLKGKKTEHPIITSLMKAWNETDNASIGNGYATSIPTAVINKGEIAEPAYLKNVQEIIDWKDTPKGRAEWEEQQRIQKEYNAKISEADQALEARELEDALRLYRLASTIKKDEAYPGEQVPKVEEMIKVRNRRNKLVESVTQKSDKLEAEQKRILAIEDFEKKQKHLFEAYNIGYDYLNRKLRSDHSRVQSNMSNNLIEKIEIKELEAYEADLNNTLDYQSKTAGWIGKDTKDLEKELKKMEDPKEIVARLSK